jgi:HK97 gp10 family phage protein
MARQFKRVAGHRHVEIQGLDDLIEQMEELPRRSRSEMRKGMREAGQIVGREARRLISEPGRSGRKYVFDKKGVRREVTASAPGEPPARVLRLLLKSIKVKAAKSGLAVRILSADRKAHLMEYGTVKIKPRPFLRPALERKKREVLEALEVGYFNALKVALGFRSSRR